MLPRRALTLAGLIALLTPGSVAVAAPVKRALTPTPPQWVPGELVVQFESGVAPAERRALHAENGAELEQRISGFRVDVVELPDGLSVPEALARYEDDPAVVLAEPNYLRYPAYDPLSEDLWGLENTGQEHRIADPDDGVTTAAGTAGADIAAPEAWATMTGLPTTVVAVIDGGFDTDHPDLAPNLWEHPLDPTEHGWNFAGDNANLENPHDPSTEHGTHVAGTIAAAMDGPLATDDVVGVCPNCELMLLRIAKTDGTMTLAAELDALRYARENGADVVNMSLGAPFWSGMERSLLKATASDFLTVVAAGNESLDNDMYLGMDVNGDGVPDRFSPSFPASYSLPNVVSVAASNHRDEYGYRTGCHLRGTKKSRCAFTNWGHESVDFAAPGVDVLSTVPGGTYDTFSGTSMAAPHVAGIAGLVHSQSTLLVGYTPLQVKDALMRSVDRPSSLGFLNTRLFDQRKSGSFTRAAKGRVNADAALDVPTPSPDAPRPTDGNIDGASSISTSRTGSVQWPNDVNDVYKKRLYKNRTYRIVLDGPSKRDIDLYLWRSGAKEIWQTNVGCPGGACLRVSAGRTADETITFKPKKTGVYYVHVSAWLKSGGKYRLTVRRA